MREIVQAIVDWIVDHIPMMIIFIIVALLAIFLMFQE
jgi:hypothetical protein